MNILDKVKSIDQSQIKDKPLLNQIKKSLAKYKDEDEVIEPDVKFYEKLYDKVEVYLKGLEKSEEKEEEKELDRAEIEAKKDEPKDKDEEKEKKVVKKDEKKAEKDKEKEEAAKKEQLIVDSLSFEHVGTMEKNQFVTADLPVEIRKKINGFNMCLKRLQKKASEKLQSSLINQSEQISLLILKYIDDSEKAEHKKGELAKKAQQYGLPEDATEEQIIAAEQAESAKTDEAIEKSKKEKHKERVMDVGLDEDATEEDIEAAERVKIQKDEQEKAARAARAKAVNLPENATIEEIKAAEKEKEDDVMGWIM